MAVDKLVDSTQLNSDLTSIANAIRTKGGTSAQLAFPAGFVSAVEDIPSGGGGASVDGISTGTEPSGAITITATTLSQYAFAGNSAITSVTLANDLTSCGVNPFFNCTGLLSVSAPNLTQIIGKLFNACTNLETVSFPKVENINTDQGIESTKVTVLVFPSFNANIYNNGIRANTLLTAVDLKACTALGTRAFQNNSSMNKLIIRGDSVPTMGNINTFEGTPFASNGAGGTLYVPNDMIASYQSASNWSTILGYANNSIAKIEGTAYATAYADGTPIS